MGRSRADTWETERVAAAFDPSSPAAGWVGLGCTVDEAGEWTGAGFDAGQAAFFMALGVRVDAAARCRDGTSTVVTRAVQAFPGMEPTDAVRWHLTGFMSGSEVDWWRSVLGRDPFISEVRARWLQAGFCIFEFDAREEMDSDINASKTDEGWRYSNTAVNAARKLGVRDPTVLARVRDQLEPFWSGRDDPVRECVDAMVGAQWHVAGVDPGFGVDVVRRLGSLLGLSGQIAVVGWNEGARDAEAFVAERQSRWEQCGTSGPMFDAVGISDMDEACRWNAAGIRAGIAASWRDTGITPVELRDRHGAGLGKHANVARFLYERDCPVEIAAHLIGRLPS